MSVFLFISPEKLVKETVIGGNVDTDKYLFAIENAQITTLEPLFGSELYDKLKADYIADTLAGDYLTIYNEYLVPILKYQSAAEYIEVCSYMVENGGIFRPQPDNKEIPTRQDIDSFAQKYRGLAESFIQRFQKWICLHNIEEYKLNQDEVNADKDINSLGGFYFGNAQTRGKWD